MFASSKRRDSALVEIGDGTESARRNRESKFTNPMMGTIEEDREATSALEAKRASADLVTESKTGKERRVSALVEMGAGTAAWGKSGDRGFGMTNNPLGTAHKPARRISALVHLGAGNNALSTGSDSISFSSNPMLSRRHSVGGAGKDIGARVNGDVGSGTGTAAGLEPNSVVSWGTSKSTGSPALCGWLHKLGHQGKWNAEWKKRFFVLSGADLDFFADEAQLKLKGSIDLSKIKKFEVLICV